MPVRRINGFRAVGHPSVAPADGEALVWDNAAQDWVAGSAGGLPGAGEVTASMLEDPLDLSDHALTLGPIQGRTGVGYPAVGELGEASQTDLVVGSATSLVTATAKTVISKALTAGDWEVWGVLKYVLSGTTSTKFVSGVSQVTNTLPATAIHQAEIPLILTTVTDTFGHLTPRCLISLAAPATVYLVGQATFSAGTVTAWGSIMCRRMS